MTIADQSADRAAPRAGAPGRTGRGARPQRLAPGLADHQGSACSCPRPAHRAAIALGSGASRSPTTYIATSFERRGVQATYTLDRVGFAPSRSAISSSAIPPTRPHRPRGRSSRCGSNGTAASKSIASSARGVRLKGQLLADGRVSWGQIDKLLPPPSGKPFRLPNCRRSTSPTARSRWQRPMADGLCGRRARQSDRAGSRGAGGVAPRPGRSAPAARPVPRLRRYRRRRPPARRRPDRRASSIARPATCISRAADGDRQLHRGVRQLRRQGPADDGLVRSRRQRPCRRQRQPHASRARRRMRSADRSGGAAGAAGRIFADRTRFDGRYRLDARAGRLDVVGDYGARAAAASRRR